MASDGPEGICGWCRHFLYLSDAEREGVCELSMDDDLGRECSPARVLDWAYANTLSPDSEACEMWEEE